MPLKMQIFTFLFLMLGPFKIIAPFAKMTSNATPELTRQLAIRAIIFSSLALLLAAILGENILSKYGIPLPVLSMSGGIILFLVALLNVIKQFGTIEKHDENIPPPTLNMAMSPLAFPTIVTPYGIAAVIDNASELWLKRDHKHDLAFRPLETALEKGVIDAMYSQSKVLSVLSETTGKFKSIEDLSRYPDWTLQVANVPAAITCTDVMAKEHPELVIAFMKGMIKVGRWANEHKHAAAVILDKQTYYRDVEDTYEGIRRVDMVPNLSPQNLVCVEIGKDFMLKNGYIKNDFDVHKWAAPEFLEQAAKELLEEKWKKVTGNKLPDATELLASSKRIG